ncbi:hypothetical protein FMUBM48_49480 [Nocardia cyriacigeorgica]|nr:hypothetical protein FMUBM48_49480 [Nocardia cyriacigeorgica]
MSSAAVPIGTLSRSAAVTSWAVTSTAASVGPYRLCRVAPLISRNAAAVAAGRASPEAKTSRKLSMDCAALGSATNTASIDGTKCVTVTPDSPITRARYAGSRCPSGRAITSRAPTCNGQKNSHTDTSKVNGVFCNTTSSAPSRYSRCRQRRFATIERCDTATPLGRPVEPEVKMT